MNHYSSWSSDILNNLQNGMCSELYPLNEENAQEIFILIFNRR
jgi:hypothetical protein